MVAPYGGPPGGVSSGKDPLFKSEFSGKVEAKMNEFIPADLKKCTRFTEIGTGYFPICPFLLLV